MLAVTPVKFEDQSKGLSALQTTKAKPDIYEFLETNLSKFTAKKLRDSMELDLINERAKSEDLMFMTESDGASAFPDKAE